MCSRCLGLLLAFLVMAQAGAQEAMSSSSSAAAMTDILETPVAIEGTVAEIFGNRFIFESSGERMLVEPADLRAVLTAKRGDTVRVEGKRTGAIIRGERVLRGSEVVLLSPAAALTATLPPARSSEQRGITAVVQDLGLQPIGAPLRKKHHTELLARMPDGRTVYVSFDRSDRLWEIEDAEHDKKSVVPRGFTREDYDRLAREAGFKPTGAFEQKREHVELEATNRRGELLELHIDRAGTIYKQVWLR